MVVYAKKLCLPDVVVKKLQADTFFCKYLKINLENAESEVFFSVEHIKVHS